MTHLYHSPLGLHQFQAEGVAKAYLNHDMVALWDPGLGKTHCALALAAVLLEDGEVDHVIICCEKDKLDKTEWPSDAREFTDIEFEVYKGDPKKRAKIREAMPPMLLSTYETLRNDVAVFTKGMSKQAKPADGPLLEALLGKRVLLVHDEATKMKNRTSQNHRAHKHFTDRLREQEGGDCRVLGLTATPVEKGLEDYYNLLRIPIPEVVGTVADFEQEHVEWRNEHGQARCKNISPKDNYEPWVTPFTIKVRDHIHIKHKTDPDVVDQFPEMTEEYTVRPLKGAHKTLYELIDAFLAEEFPEDRQGFRVLRQVALYPESLLHGESQVAEAIVEAVGAEALMSTVSTKMAWLLEVLERTVEQADQQALVFCFYGPSVLPLIARDLTDAGYRVAQNHGAVGNKDREQAKADFKDGKVQILLSSDAGSRGLNFPDVSYVVNYDVPLTHANYTQRNNRVHRIGSGGLRFAHTLMATNTLDDAIFGMWNRTERESDLVITDDSDEDTIMSHAIRQRLVEGLRSKARAAA